MAVEGVSDFIMSNAIRDNAVKQDKDLSMDDFLQLMVAQLKNQDMFSPTDNSQFLNQMAQFSMINAMMGMSELSSMAYSTSLIGKMATAAYMDGGKMIVDEGIVEAVYMFNGSAEVVIGGKEYQLGNIMTVYDASNPVGGNEKLVDNSGLIGKFARLLHTNPEGDYDDISGRITGIRLIEGKVYAIIDDKAYPLTEINALNEIAVQAQNNDEEKTGEGKNTSDTNNKDQEDNLQDIRVTSAANSPEDVVEPSNVNDPKDLAEAAATIDPEKTYRADGDSPEDVDETGKED